MLFDFFGLIFQTQRFLTWNFGVGLKLWFFLPAKMAAQRSNFAFLKLILFIVFEQDEI